MNGRHSSLYLGVVTHRRFRPKTHSLRYRMFFALLDLDEVDALSRSLRWFSAARFNLFSFFDRDHGDGGERPLRAQVEKRLAEAGIDLEGGAIRLLALPRMLGYVFNPLSVYFCYRQNGELAALLYEVSNTFGERHSYIIPATLDGDGRIRQHCAKDFFVSPFMDMDMGYGFLISPPGDEVSITIKAEDGDGTLLTAAFSGKRTELTDRTLLSCFVRYPLLTLKVVAGIHYEALRLWGKGVALRRKPAPPQHAVTISTGAYQPK